MGLGDRFRAWLRGDDPDEPRLPAGGAASRRGGASMRAGRGRRGRSGPPSDTFDDAELLAFARSRRGVEVYLEPRTKLYGTSVLLVADDGEYLRRPVPDAATVRRFCDRHGIPVYDAARTGYPRRVRDYDRGVRPSRIELTDLPPWPGDDGPAEDGPPEEPGPPPPPVG